MTDFDVRNFGYWVLFILLVCAGSFIVAGVISLFICIFFYK